VALLVAGTAGFLGRSLLTGWHRMCAVLTILEGYAFIY
jgi:hypothetical protein